MSPSTIKVQWLTSRADHWTRQPHLNGGVLRVYRKTQRKSRRNGTPIYVDTREGRRCVGYVVTENGHLVLQKARLSERRHFCKKHRGWGIDEAVLEEVHRMGVEIIRIITDDTKVTEEALVEDYLDHGITDNLGGFGRQVFLPRSYFHHIRGGQPSLFGGDA